MLLTFFKTNTWPICITKVYNLFSFFPINFSKVYPFFNLFAHFSSTIREFFESEFICNTLKFLRIFIFKIIPFIKVGNKYVNHILPPCSFTTQIWTCILLKTLATLDIFITLLAQNRFFSQGAFHLNVSLDHFTSKWILFFANSD